MAQRKDYQLAKTRTFALEKDTYELLLKYAGLASESILAKEKLIAIDSTTKALLVRFVNRIAADAISIEDAGNYYISQQLEEILQKIGSAINGLGDGVLRLRETTTPTANANYGKVYCKNDNKLYFQDGAGVEHEITLV